ncbi:MAG TPA: mechanosensitive ion channel family protein [Candidatus Saccharimonadales bacterium]|nr:mechanosensitive ion channel family protein [Candidatus Saccharimonadales bacterium]
MWLETIFSNPVAQIIIILIVAGILHRLSGAIITTIVQRALRKHVHETQTDRKKRADTISNVFGTTAGVAVWIVAGFAILRVFDVDFTSIAAGAGFLGIVIGLGAQATIRDYLAGVFILLENQYRVGDVVTLSGGTTGIGTSGVVEDISLRITKIRDLDGALNIIRNGEASIITNLTFEYSSIVLDVTVAYDADIDVIERIINRIGKDMAEESAYEKEFDEPIQFLRVDRFADSGVVVKALGKVTPAMQWELAGEYRRRLLKAFIKEGIEIALPQLVVHQQKSTK